MTVSFSKKLLIFIIILSMFSFTNKSFAEYEKIFFDLSIKNIDGNDLELSWQNILSGKSGDFFSTAIFLIKDAGLQELWETYKDRGLIALGVPSNQFGGQEPGTNREIKKFCEVNFNVNFPMTDKVDVKGENIHPIYLWAKQNYGNSAIPKWNFHKILIQNTYTSLTKPTSKKITNEIEIILDKE